MIADLIVASEVRTPAAFAFDVILVSIIEPHAEAVFP
jgi:hypothetical protein